VCQELELLRSRKLEIERELETLEEREVESSKRVRVGEEVVEDEVVSSSPKAKAVHVMYTDSTFETVGVIEDCGVVAIEELCLELCTCASSVFCGDNVGKAINTVNQFARFLNSDTWASILPKHEPGVPSLQLILSSLLQFCGGVEIQTKRKAALDAGCVEANREVCDLVSTFLEEGEGHSDEDGDVDEEDRTDHLASLMQWWCSKKTFAVERRPAKDTLQVVATLYVSFVEN
jgi:hypothetical protein